VQQPTLFMRYCHHSKLLPYLEPTLYWTLFSEEYPPRYIVYVNEVVKGSHGMSLRGRLINHYFSALCQRIWRISLASLL
jgi:hypothetical protein